MGEFDKCCFYTYLYRTLVVFWGQKENVNTVFVPNTHASYVCICISICGPFWRVLDGVSVFLFDPVFKCPRLKSGACFTMKSSRMQVFEGLNFGTFASDACILSSRGRIGMTQVGGESWFEELSNDRSHAQIQYPRTKL